MTDPIVIKLTPPEEGAKTVFTSFSAPFGQDLLIKAIDGNLPKNTFLIIRKGDKVVFESLSKIINRDDNFLRSRILVKGGEPIQIELSSPTKFKKEGTLQFAVEELR